MRESEVGTNTGCYN